MALLAPLAALVIVAIVVVTVVVLIPAGDRRHIVRDLPDLVRAFFRCRR